MVEKVFPP